MKKISLLITILIIFTLNLFSQANYVFERDIFKLIKKIETAKKFKIKTINTYSNYKDSLNKGKCKIMESYDSTGNLIKRVYTYPYSKTFYISTFVYDKNGRLVEVCYYYFKSNEPYLKRYLDYYENNQVKSITQKYTKSNTQSDTLFYYYSKDGRYDYKVWGKSPNFKKYIHYNKCNQIEYVESFPFKKDRIQLDSNDCLIFMGTEKFEDLLENEMFYIKRINDNNCQNLSYYSVDNCGKDWSIYSSTNEYDTNNKLLRSTFKESHAKTLTKCENKLKINSVHEYKYNDKGLEIFHKTTNEKGKLENIVYTEYIYY